MNRCFVICFKKERGKCTTISVSVAPYALKFIFGAFVIIFAKGDRILAILKTVISW
jgi:hypothetical protein